MSMTHTTSSLHHLQKIINDHVPEKQIHLNKKCSIREKWMTKGLLVSSTNRTKLYRNSLGKSPTDPQHKEYTDYRNLFNRIKRTAKQMYYEKKI